MSEALYRKYRPQVFSDVVGQDEIVHTLQNSIAQNRLSHAYLFCGPRGTGKTTMARLLAKALLCENGMKGAGGSVQTPQTPQNATFVDPCGTCEECMRIARGDHPDVHELDAASRTGVESVREEIINRLQFSPTRGAYTIYIIDEVHMLSTQAFNALLKSLEEPPAHVVFVLCTTDPQKIPDTILSRCLRFDFKRITQNDIVKRLGDVCAREGIKCEREVLETIAGRVDGGMRDALTSLEQVIAFCEGDISSALAANVLGQAQENNVYEFVSAVGKRDVSGCFGVIDALVQQGVDLQQFASDCAQYMRDLYVVSMNIKVSVVTDEAAHAQMASLSPLFGKDRLMRDMCVLDEVLRELKVTTNERLTLEIAAVRMARPESDISLEALAERIEVLESQRGGAPNAEVPRAEVANAQQPHPDTMQNASTQKNTHSQNNVQNNIPSSVQRNTQSNTQNSEARGNTPVRMADVSAWGETVKNKASLDRLWSRIQTAFKGISGPHAAFFANAHAIWVPEEEMVEVQLRGVSDFLAQRAQDPAVLNELGRAVEQVLGVRAPFRVKSLSDAECNSTMQNDRAQQNNFVQEENVLPSMPATEPANSFQLIDDVPLEDSVDTEFVEDPQFQSDTFQEVHQSIEETYEEIHEEIPEEVYGETYDGAHDKIYDEASGETQDEIQDETPKEDASPQATPDEENWRENLESVFGDIPIEKIE